MAAPTVANVSAPRSTTKTSVKTRFPWANPGIATKYADSATIKSSSNAASTTRSRRAPLTVTRAKSHIDASSAADAAKPT